jgi:hypothetical protein
MSDARHTLLEIPGRYAIACLPADAAWPAWATAGPFWSVTRTPDELSVIAAQDRVPPTLSAQRDWTLWQVAGPFDFEVTGVLAALSASLAQAGVPLLAVATYQTDYILVQAGRRDAALQAWTAAGHTVIAQPSASIPSPAIPHGGTSWPDPDSASSAHLTST